MAQNIYDDAEFFAAYETLPRSQQGLAGTPEWPVLQSMVLGDGEDMAGRRVLDMGCGYGWFVRWAVDAGAEHVKGVDISQKMIDKAKEFGHDDRIELEVGNFETVSVNESSYDLVYSSLALHYIQDLAHAYSQMNRALKPGGTIVFSVEHPVCSAPIRPGPDWKVLKDYETDEGQERTVWPLNGYCDEGWRITTWLGVDGIKKYHRTVETYVNTLMQNGFMLTSLKDWSPRWEDVAKHPDWAVERHRPYFLLISAQKL